MEEMLEEALAIIRAITVAGELKIRQKLLSLSLQERQEVIRYMQRAERLGWFWQSSWKEAARAYMLVHVATWISPMGYAPPRDLDQQLALWLRDLRTLQESVVRRTLTDMVSSRGVLQRIARAQVDGNRAPWGPGHFSNPLHHNPKQFCYFVHAMRPTTGLPPPSLDTVKMMAHIEAHLGNFITKDKDKGWLLRSAELYLSNPSLIHAEMLSCSIINESSTKLYGDFCFGFILKVPSANVCIAAPRDLAISNAQARACVLAMQPSPLHRILQIDDFLENLLGLYSQDLPTPATILSESCGKGHNEVVILGSTGTSFVQVAAIFVKVTSGNKLWKSFAAQDAAYGLRSLMLDCSRRLSVPIIAIHDDNDKQPGCDIDFDDWLNDRAFMPSPPTKLEKPEKAAVASSSGAGTLVLGNHISTYRAPGLEREYLMPEIRQRAQQLLAQGRSPAQVHRTLHDDEHLPHEVVQHVLNGLGHHNYF